MREVPITTVDVARPTLQASDVRLEYRALSGGEDVVTALHDVNLSVPAGQFIALVGASGCGKTSLLNLFAGLLKPSIGTIEVHGKAPRGPSSDVGYMFARDALLPWRTCRRNIELGLERPNGPPRAERRQRSQELLEYVGLEGFGNAFPRQLSQGMRQRAALARTLAPDPRTLLMDEPFAALDAQTKLRLQSEFLDIWEQTGDASHRKTVLFVTHDLQEALLLSDRVIVMLPSPGRIAHDQMIDLPRPRARRLTEIMFDERFHALHEKLFHQLEAGGETTPDGEATARESQPVGEAP